RMWLLLACLHLMRPPPASLNRFFAPLWVFAFDIVSHSALKGSRNNHPVTSSFSGLSPWSVGGLPFSDAAQRRHNPPGRFRHASTAACPTPGEPFHDRDTAA